MAPLSDRQTVVLRFIRRFIADHEFAPTPREIADHLGLPAPSTVAADLDALQLKGCLRWTPGLARSIKLPSNQSGPERLLWDISNQAFEPAAVLAGAH